MADPSNDDIRRTRDDLSRMLGAGAVEWDEGTLREHSHDWWMVSQLRLLRGTLGKRPACVVNPGNTEQVRQILTYAN